MPVFSVVIPVYNNEPHVEEAVQSVLEQDFTDIEIIIVFDPGTDATEQIIDKLAEQNDIIEIVKNEKRMGVAASRNMGMMKASGEHVAFLDADDIWCADKLRKQFELIQRTGCDICYSSYRFIDENGKSTGRPFYVRDNIDFKGLLYGNIIGTTTCVISGELAKKYKMDANFHHEDFVFWLTMLRDGYTACGVSDVLALYRLREGSRSWQKLKMPKHRWAVYRVFLEYNVFKSFWYSCINLIRATIKYSGTKRIR